MDREGITGDNWSSRIGSWQRGEADHIRTAVGRDCADVPPTQGIFRGQTNSEPCVAVHVEASDHPPALDRKLPIPEDWSVLVEKAQQPPPRPQPLIDLQQMQKQAI